MGAGLPNWLDVLRRSLADRCDATGLIETAKAFAAEHGLNAFHDRLAAFQKEDVKSDHEGAYYDDFFGWMNPEHFDSAGDVIKRDA